MTTIQRQTGIAMIAIPVVFMAAFTGLQMTFDYPNVLRLPAAEILERFQAGGGGLLAIWYVFMAAALAFIPLAVLSALWLWPRHQTGAAFAATFGILAGLVQGLGLLRWVVLVPSLAANHAATSANDAVNEAVFEAFHLYAGAGVGEHFGYLFTALWTLFIVAALWSERRWFAVIGAVLALGILAGMAEPFGLAAAGAINAIAYSVWAIWLLALGIMLVWKQPVALATGAGTVAA
jgi:uncharacterized protein DUF4386